MLSLHAPCQGVRAVLRPRQEGPSLEGPTLALLLPWPSPQDEESFGPSGQVPLEPVTSLLDHILSTYDPKIPCRDALSLCPVEADLFLVSFPPRRDTLDVQTFGLKGGQ